MRLVLKNILYIDRKRWEILKGVSTNRNTLSSLLDFIVIRNNDGSFEMVKNRYEGITGKVSKQYLDDLKGRIQFQNKVELNTAWGKFVLNE